MMDSDLQSSGGFTGDNGQPIPPGYWLNPATGQIEPVPQGAPPPQTPLAPGTTRDPTTGAVIYPAYWQMLGQPAPPGAPDPSVAAAITPPTTTGGGAPGTNVGTQTPPDIYNSPLTAPYSGVFNAPAPVNLGGPAGIPYIPPTPTFTGANAPPQLGNIPAFKPPSLADLMNDPAYAGYQFGQQQGMNGIQNAAAARGTLNDSSTFKALSDYNTGNAEQYAGGIYNQALNTYGANLQSQYELPYQANFANWMSSVVSPTMTGYSTQATAGANQNNLNYQNAWAQYLNNQNLFTNWQDRTFNKLFQTATA